MKLTCDCGNEMKFKKSNDGDYYYDEDKFRVGVGYGEEIELTCKICNKYVEIYRDEKDK